MQLAQDDLTLIDMLELFTDWQVGDVDLEDADDLLDRIADRWHIVSLLNATLESQA